jgi:tetratricopeptide (TPR) repeat protein
MISLREQGRYQEALVYANQQLRTSRRSGDRLFEGYALYHVGKLIYLEHDLDRAVEPLEESLRISQELGALETILYSNRMLAEVQIRRGEYFKAAPVLRELQQEWMQAGFRGEVGFWLDLAGVLAAAMSMPTLAVQLFGFWAAYNASLGLRAAQNPWVEDALEDAKVGLRAELGESEFQSLYNRGLTLTLDEAIEIASEVLDRVEQQSPV